jgi:hypothetical protein
MQVILVCVAHAAQKTWYANKLTNGDPEDVTVPGGLSSPEAAGTGGTDSVDTPGSRFWALWEIITGFGDSFVNSPAGPVFPSDTGPNR